MSKNKCNLVPCFDKKSMGLFVYLICCKALVEVIVIYEVYIDVYFVENVLLDMLVLLSMALLFWKKPILWRLLLASAIGGAGSVLLLCIGIGYGIPYIMSVLVLDIIMCMILFFDMEKLAIQVVYFHGICFAYVKIGECITSLGFAGLGIPVAFTLLVLAALLLYRYRKNVERKRLYTVKIVENGKEYEFNALFDTGNLLKDPYTGKPVSIVEENEDILDWLNDKPQKYRIIPFKSIGTENGLLEGTEVDELIICREDGKKIERDAVIAFYKGKLSCDNSYQVILNQGLF